MAAPSHTPGCSLEIRRDRSSRHSSSTPRRRPAWRCNLEGGRQRQCPAATVSRRLQRRSGTRCAPAAGRWRPAAGRCRLLLSRRRLLALGCRRCCGSAHSVPDDGAPAPDAKNRVRFGHQLHGQKRYIGHEHHDKGSGDAAILSIVFICFLLLVSAAGPAGSFRVA